MRTERWGSLSVADHVDTDSLTASVLLFDRLVVPVMVDQPDRNERAYWVARGWDPDLQDRRLEQLGDLAVRRPWSKARRACFDDRWSAIKAEQDDALRMADAHGVTRRIL